MARVFRSKYCVGRCDIDIFKAKADSSNVWKGITHNINDLRKALVWC